MKRVKCKSGIEGWQDKLQNVYSSFEEFEAYSDMYGIALRIGFISTKNAWDANPTIQGSTDPSDLCVIPVKPKKIKKEIIIRNHVKDILKQSHSAMLEKVLTLLKSGAIDIEGYEIDNKPMILPKSIVLALFESESRQYDGKGTGYEKEIKANVKNFRYFI
jgi:hypothetical protein